MAVLIDGTPEIMPCPINSEKHLVQVPLIARPGTPMPELIRIGLAELAAPLPNGLIRHDDATGEQELFHVAVAETEPEIEPDAMADDVRWKSVILVCQYFGQF